MAFLEKTAGRQDPKENPCFYVDEVRSASTRWAPAPNHVGHIIEEPGGIRHMVDCEVPPDAYYVELEKDMIRRHPRANKHVISHLQALEAFFDNSILAGFSFGVEKARLFRVKATLLGNLVGRAVSDPPRTPRRQRLS